MTRWGICATVRAPAEQVLAFVGHHLTLNPDHIWLHFDDPADPAIAAVAGLPRVTAIACDLPYWRALNGHRPDRHQLRQARNIRRLCDEAPVAWIAHLDVDEFLCTARPIPDILSALPAGRLVLRVEPWEALHDPALPDDIFTARHFRAALRGADRAADRSAVFGRYAPLLVEGVLSHAAGKCFFRTGIPRLAPRLHGAFRDKERVPGGAFHPDLALLHFHAQDPARWLANLPFRLTLGAYQFNPPLQSFLMAATPAETAAFYETVQHATPATLATLRALGALREESLGLRAIMPPAPPPFSGPR